MKKMLWMSVMMFAVLAVSACKQKEEQGMPKVEAPVQATGAGQVSKEQDDFSRQVQTEIDELAARLENLKSKAAAAKGRVQEKLDKQIVALDADKKAAEEKLASLKAAVGDSWKTLKAEVTAALDKFRDAVMSAEKS